MHALAILVTILSVTQVTDSKKVTLGRNFTSSKPSTITSAASDYYPTREEILRNALNAQKPALAQPKIDPSQKFGLLTISSKLTKIS